MYLKQLPGNLKSKKNCRLFFFFFLVKIRPEIMFSDALNIKEASPEYKDAFYGGRKEAMMKFCLSVFLSLDMVP